MFRTNAEDLAGIAGMFGDGLAHWHAISRCLPLHWYHVSVSTRQEDRLVSHQEFVNDESQLQRLLSTQSPDMVVTDVQVVTPARVNGGDAWRMERLRVVSMGKDVNDIPVCVLEVESGSIYHDSFDKDVDVTALQSIHELYRA